MATARRVPEKIRNAGIRSGGGIRGCIMMGKLLKAFDWRSHLKVHPAADLFPPLSEAELKELAANIKANGLLHAIVIDEDLNLLDGRNRLDALALLGALEPPPGGRGLRLKGDARNLLADSR